MASLSSRSPISKEGHVDEPQSACWADDERKRLLLDRPLHVFYAKKPTDFDSSFELSGVPDITHEITLIEFTFF